MIVCDLEPAEFYCETLKAKGLSSNPARVYKAGELVAEDGHVRGTPTGKTLAATPRG